MGSAYSWASFHLWLGGAEECGRVNPITDKYLSKNANCVPGSNTLQLSSIFWDACAYRHKEKMGLSE